MSSLDLETTQGGAESAPSQTQQVQGPGMAAPVPGLPPTALQMQVQSLRQQQEQQQQQALGAQMGGMGGGAFPAQLGAPRGAPVNADYARSSLRDLAERLASGYGLQFGPGELVDQQGQFLQTPDQLGAGGDLSDTASYMNLVAQAINERQIQAQQSKATAALQAGAGLIQKRGAGSLAAMQSGFYQAMAANYTNPNLLPEQQDFSFWIQKDQMEQAEADRAAEVGPGQDRQADAKLQQDLAAQQASAQQAQADYDRALQQARNSSRAQQTRSRESLVPTYKPYIPGGY